jgi:hypothetical protein
MGDVPFLLRQGEAVFSVNTDATELPRVWALKYDGSRSAQVAPRQTPTGFAFTAKAVADENTYFAFEILW